MRPISLPSHHSTASGATRRKKRASVSTFSTFATILLLAATPALSAPARDVLATNTESRWVPFDLTPGNQIRFTLILNGKPVTAILDTGVSFSVLSRNYAEASRLPIRAGGKASAIGGGVTIGWVDARSISLGGLTRTGGRVSVVVLPANATGSDRPIDMLVGRDLTAGYALDIDYEAKRFRLLPSGRLPFTGRTAPLAISPDRLVYVTEINVGTSRIRPMIVDTGDGNAITLSGEAWKTAKITAPPPTSTISFGLGGAIVTDLVIIPEARFGALTARNVEVQIEGPGGFSHSIGMAGRIGSGFLQRYRVLLDPAAKRMVLRPGPEADQPPLRSTSGLLVASRNDQLEILHVMRGSPGEAAGWKTGDRICSVDGAAIPADYAANTLANWSVGTPGRVVTLGVCGGPVRQLMLRQFY